MSYRKIASVVVAALIGVACVSTDALAFRGGGRAGGARGSGVYHAGVYRGGGVYHAGVYRGGAYRGAYVRRGIGVGVGAAAVGAAVAAPYYYNSTQCGYDPYPPCY